MTDTPDNQADPVQYTGQADAVIGYATDVWLRDANGENVNLIEAFRGLPRVLHTCEDTSDVIDGIFAPVNDEFGIQRCDMCDVFPGDFEAAQAIADLLGGGLTIWFHPSTSTV